MNQEGCRKSKEKNVHCLQSKGCTSDRQNLRIFPKMGKTWEFFRTSKTCLLIKMFMQFIFHELDMFCVIVSLPRNIVWIKSTVSNNKESNLSTDEDRITTSTMFLVKDNDKKLQLANNLSSVIETMSKQHFNGSKKKNHEWVKLCSVVHEIITRRV